MINITYLESIIYHLFGEGGSYSWICVTTSHFTSIQLVFILPLTHGEKKRGIHKPTDFKENKTWITSMRYLKDNTGLLSSELQCSKKSKLEQTRIKTTYGPLSQQQQTKKHVSESFLIALQVLILIKY